MLTSMVMIQSGLLTLPGQLLPSLLSFLVELYVSLLLAASQLFVYIVTVGIFKSVQFRLRGQVLEGLFVLD